MYYFTKHKVTLHTIEGHIHKQKYKDVNCKNDYQICDYSYFYDKKEMQFEREIQCAFSRCEMFYFLSFIVNTCSL